jgi:arylsulfatase A-like enzyme
MEFKVERDEDLPDGLMAQTALQQLQQLKEKKQPFFLGLGFFKPHLPFVATKQDWDAFANELPNPPMAPDKIDSPYWHKSAEFYRYKAPYEKSNPLDAAAQITARRAYYACVRYVDRQIGKVLQEIDRLDLAQNTIVVIWGDHGWHLGEQQIWGKHDPFERAVRSVLLMRVPGVTKAGVVSKALVETTDLYPTLMDLCAITERETTHPLDGQSLRSVLDGSQSQIRTTAISYWSDAVSIRSDTHRLIAKKKDNELTPVELYELINNPDSAENVLSQQPEQVKTLSALAAQRLGLTIISP